LCISLGFIPQLREYLDKREERAKKGPSIAIISFDGFGLPMSRLVLYASLLIFVVLNYVSLAAGFISGMMGTPENYSAEEMNMIAGLFVVFFAFPIIFLIGRWIGKIHISNGPITIVLAASLAAFSNNIMAILLFPDQEELAHYSGDDSLLLKMFFGIIMISVIGLIGFRWGRKEKLSAYVSYLLKQLSPEARASMVKALFEETKNISRAQIRPAQGSPIQQPDVLNNPSQVVAQEHIDAVIVAINGPLRGKQFAVKTTFVMGKMGYRLSIKNLRMVLISMIID
jgi:hypothetical protein